MKVFNATGNKFGKKLSLLPQIAYISLEQCVDGAGNMKNKNIRAVLGAVPKGRDVCLGLTVDGRLSQTYWDWSWDTNPRMALPRRARLLSLVIDAAPESNIGLTLPAPWALIDPSQGPDKVAALIKQSLATVEDLENADAFYVDARVQPGQTFDTWRQALDLKVAVCELMHNIRPRVMVNDRGAEPGRFVIQLQYLQTQELDAVFFVPSADSGDLPWATQWNLWKFNNS